METCLLAAAPGTTAVLFRTSHSARSATMKLLQPPQYPSSVSFLPNCERAEETHPRPCLESIRTAQIRSRSADDASFSWSWHRCHNLSKGALPKEHVPTYAPIVYWLPIRMRVLIQSMPPRKPYRYDETRYGRNGLLAQGFVPQTAVYSPWRPRHPLEYGGCRPVVVFIDFHAMGFCQVWSRK